MEFIVLPGMLHLNLAKARINDYVQVGSQNVSNHSNGQFTGEVSAEQLADYDIAWILVGHNERRTLYNESQEVIT
jgi:triosephosphate isomerase